MNPAAASATIHWAECPLDVEDRGTAHRLEVRDTHTRSLDTEHTNLMQANFSLQERYAAAVSVFARLAGLTVITLDFIGDLVSEAGQYR